MSLKLLFRKLASPIYQQKNKLTFVVLFSVLVIFFIFGLTSQVSAAFCGPHIMPIGPGAGTVGNDPGTPPYPPCPAPSRCNTNTGFCVYTGNNAQADVRRINAQIARSESTGKCGFLNDNAGIVACPVGRGLQLLSNLIPAYFIAVPVFVLTLLALAIKALLIGTLALVTSGVSYTSLDQTLSPAVATGWPIVRNFANIILVLGLIVISLATILRVKTYEAKQLLGKFIIVALLVNFSAVICGVIIDISNILLVFFLRGGAPNSTETINLVPQELVNLWSMITGTDPLHVFLSKVIGNMLFNLAYIATIPLYICLFLFRVIALWILVILSPLAFVCSVFPQTQKIYEEWKSNFIQWCFVGVYGALFLFLGNKINATMTTSTSNIVSTLVNARASGAGSMGGEFTQSLTGLFSFIVPALFLVIGFIFSLKFSAMGSDIALSAGKTLSSKARSFAMDNSGVTRLKNMAQDRATYIGEKLGIVGVGTSAVNRKKRIADKLDEKSRTDNANDRSGQERLAELRKTTFTEDGLIDKAANFKAMVRDDQLHLIEDNNEQMKYLRNSIEHGVKAHEVVGKMSTENQVTIATSNEFNPKVREEAAKALGATGQLSRLNADQIRTIMTDARNNGSDLKDIVKVLGGQDLANLITQHQVNMAVGGSGIQVLDAETRRKITEALADKKQLDLIGRAGEDIAERRLRKVNAIVEAAENGALPQNLVDKLNTDDKAAILNDQTLLLDRLNDAQRIEVIGKAVASLTKSGETNLITPSERKEEMLDIAVQSGSIDVEDIEQKDVEAGGINDRRLLSAGATQNQINAARRARMTPFATRTVAQGAAITNLESFQTTARRQVLSEIAERLKGDQIRGLRPLDLVGPEGYTIISRFSPKQIQEIGDAEDAIRLPLRTALRTQLDALDNEIDSAIEGFPPGTAFAAKLVNGGSVAPDPDLADEREKSRLQKIRAAIDNIEP